MMPPNQQFRVTLSDEMAAEVRAKVASGEYASESDVIDDGLRALQARDRAVEDWLHDEALPSYDAYRANPERGISLDAVRAGLAGRYGNSNARD